MGATRKKMKKQVLIDDGYQCQQCGRFVEMETSHLDHIVPLSQNGGHERDNLQTLCLKCSKAKTASESARGRK